MSKPTPVVFIHGLWIHSNAWQPWMELFESAGYAATAPGWPGGGATVAQTRAHRDAVADKGIEEITVGYRAAIRHLPTKPIVVGHSFGGLVAQKLLAENLAVAAIAIDPGQIKGVEPIPFADPRSGLPVLSKPGDRERAISLSRKQFRYGFGNALTEQQSDELFERRTVPGPGRPLFQASAANFKKVSPAGVDTKNSGLDHC